MILRPFKKIKEQQERMEEQEKKIEKLLEQIEDCRNKEQEKEERKHKTGIWCDGCRNLLKDEYNHPVFGKCTDRFCKFDCKCEDRNESNS